MMISEVPFLYNKEPSKGTRTTLRYVLNEGTFERCSDLPPPTTDAPSPSLDHLVGASSISSLDEGSSDDILVSTNAVDESLLNVTLVDGTTIRRVELALMQQLQTSIAKVTCFRKGLSELQLFVADSRACISIIVLELSTLAPLSYRAVDIPQVLNENHGVDYSGAELHTTMVEFVNATKVIVALSPHVLTVNLATYDVNVWSEREVKEQMNASVRSVLNRAGAALLGTVELGDAAVKPVSALSMADGEVYTLHTDSTLRQWVLDPIYSRPTQVYTISTTLPNPQRWVTSSPFSFSLETRVIENSHHLLTVVHIETRDGSQIKMISSDSRYPANQGYILDLQLPENQSRVVALGLSTLCNLMVVVETTDSQILHLLYSRNPRSNYLSIQPTIIPSECTLDGIFDVQAQRFEAWTLPPDCDGANTQDLFHSVDTYFLRLLFRPTHVQGTGTVVGPSPAILQAAVSRLVQGFQLNPRRLQVSLLLAMKEWQTRQREASASVSLSSVDVYSAYASFSEMQIDESDAAVEPVRAVGLQEHVRRWKHLIRAIAEEERRNSLALLQVTSLPSGQFVLFRSNVVSILMEPDESEYQATNDVDKTSMQLVTEVEKNNHEELYKFEALLMDRISSVGLILQDNADISIMARSVFAKGGAKTTNRQKKQRERMAKGVSPAFLAQIEPSRLELPGLSVLTTIADNMASNGAVSSAVVSPDVRHASAFLAIRGMDSLRRLTLGRCLLVANYSKDDAVINIAFCKYLESLATLWAWGQQVPMPSSVTFASPPNKRLSFGDGDDAKSILGGKHQQTTSLDAHLMQLSRNATELSLGESILSITQEVLRSACRTFVSNGSQYSLLPELGPLPCPSKANIASDYPRLALRLLSPAILFPPKGASHNAMLARTEAVAECLLIESTHCSPAKSVKMKQHANMLLDNIATSDVEFDSGTIHTTYEKLVSAGMNLKQTRDIDSTEVEMTKGVQMLLHGLVGEVRNDIRLACEQATLRSAFLPLYAAGPLKVAAEQEVMVKELLRALLHLSKLINRLSIIERQTDRLGRLDRLDNPVNLVFQTRRTIDQIHQMFPSDMRICMPEYIKLWAMLFRHAEAAQDWKEAHDACVNNPNRDQASKNFDQLVRGMVDAGDMNMLLHMCASSTIASEEDLHEIVANALTPNSSGDRLSIGSKSPDFLGCLYCHHVTSGEWKRSAEAMDLRFEDARQALFRDGYDSAAAAADLPLSALACSIAIELVPSMPRRFIVRGEYGPIPPLPPVGGSSDEVIPKSILHKRDVAGNATKPGDGRASLQNDDRLSRLMTAKTLHVRAIRSMAFETCFLDNVATPLLPTVLDTPFSDTDAAVIDHLAKHGFYSLAIDVAKSRQACIADQNGICMPNGRDLLHDAYSHVICSYLVKLTTLPIISSSSGDMDIDEIDPQAGRMLSQLRSALTTMSGGNPTSFPSTSRDCSFKLLVNSALRSTSSEMIRKIVASRDSSSTPIALEVAECMLQNSSSRLPKWLEDHLSGCCGMVQAGLFGSRGGSSCSDPSALITLYIRHGRFVEACNLVSMVLIGDKELRRSGAASRVPSKGDIDFVPYNKIDLLWNLVENALGDPLVGDNLKHSLEHSRVKMENALTFHFDTLKISEAGLTSARALASRR